MTKTQINYEREKSKLAETITLPISKWLSILDDLEQLETVREQLGIEPDILLKALKEGVYYKNNYDYIIGKIIPQRLSYTSGTIIIDKHIYKYLRDYGINWALTREELEK